MHKEQETLKKMEFKKDARSYAKELKLALPLLKKLDRLTDPVKIANLLAQEGIKASKGNPDHCALAQYFKKHGVKDVSVDGDTFVINGITINVSEAVSEFVSEFGAGEYPKLVKHSDD